MLLLVIANGNVRGLVDQNVGGLEHGVGEQPDARAVLVLTRFLLELGHPVEPAHPRGALKDPGKLGVRRDRTLREQDRTLGVDPAGD